jgi:uncharacterized membrane protein YdbT with pleckstrin-like domain
MEGPAGGAVAVPMTEVVPPHLLDGGEIVLLAIKPSWWFVPMVSARWLGIAVMLIAASHVPWLSPLQQWYLLQAGLICGVARLAWATLQWVSRLYVLTNRRVMRLRGIVNVELFECYLHKVQNTELSMSLPERAVRVGTILIHTASSGATWRFIARPQEVHEKLSDAIHRAQHRGNNGF